MREKFKYVVKEKISQLPQSPGVYCFKKGKEFLYIGKAKNIRERVKNHFQEFSFKNEFFLKKVFKIGWIKTNSEIEALILEANLIKKYQPKYNIVWRDDKKYFYVGTTKENFPRIFLTHQPLKIFSPKKPDQKSISNLQFSIYNFIGPFVEGRSLKETLKVLRRVFPYRSCIKIPQKPCLWYHLHLCLAPCLLKSKVKNKIFSEIEIKKECEKNVKNILKILQGKKNEVLKNLKKEMKESAKKENYERAAKIRDQVFALEDIMAHSKIFDTEEYLLKEEKRQIWEKTEKKLRELLKTKKRISRIEAYDVSNFQGQQATGAMVTFIDGKLNKNFYRRFKIKIAGKPNDIAMIKECLKRRFNHPEWGLPDMILIDGGKAQLNLVSNLKSKISSLKSILFVTLAKKENKLYIENQKNPFFLKELPREIFNLILQLRDEAHRFARKYHLYLREKEMIK